MKQILQDRPVILSQDRKIPSEFLKDRAQILGAFDFFADFSDQNSTIKSLLDVQTLIREKTISSTNKILADAKYSGILEKIREELSGNEYFRDTFEETLDAARDLLRRRNIKIESPTQNIANISTGKIVTKKTSRPQFVVRNDDSPYVRGLIQHVVLESLAKEIERYASSVVTSYRDFNKSIRITNMNAYPVDDTGQKIKNHISTLLSRDSFDNILDYLPLTESARDSEIIASAINCALSVLRHGVLPEKYEVKMRKGNISGLPNASEFFRSISKIPYYEVFSDHTVIALINRGFVSSGLSYSRNDISSVLSSALSNIGKTVDSNYQSFENKETRELAVISAMSHMIIDAHIENSVFRNRASLGNFLSNRRFGSNASSLKDLTISMSGNFYGNTYDYPDVSTSVLDAGIMNDKILSLRKKGSVVYSPLNSLEAKSREEYLTGGEFFVKDALKNEDFRFKEGFSFLREYENDIETYVSDILDFSSLGRAVDSKRNFLTALLEELSSIDTDEELSATFFHIGFLLGINDISHFFKSMFNGAVTHDVIKNRVFSSEKFLDEVDLSEQRLAERHERACRSQTISLIDLFLKEVVRKTEGEFGAYSASYNDYTHMHPYTSTVFARFPDYYDRGGHLNHHPSMKTLNDAGESDGAVDYYIQNNTANVERIRTLKGFGITSQQDHSTLLQFMSLQFLENFEKEPSELNLHPKSSIWKFGEFGETSIHHRGLVFLLFVKELYSKCLTIRMQTLKGNSIYEGQDRKNDSKIRIRGYRDQWEGMVAGLRSALGITGLSVEEISEKSQSFKDSYTKSFQYILRFILIGTQKVDFIKRYLLYPVVHAAHMKNTLSDVRDRILTGDQRSKLSISAIKANGSLQEFLASLSEQRMGLYRDFWKNDLVVKSSHVRSDMKIEKEKDFIINAISTLGVSKTKRGERRAIFVSLPFGSIESLQYEAVKNSGDVSLLESQRISLNIWKKNRIDGSCILMPKSLEFHLTAQVKSSNSLGDLSQWYREPFSTFESLSSLIEIEEFYRGEWISSNLSSDERKNCIVDFLLKKYYQYALDINMSDWNFAERRDAVKENAFTRGVSLDLDNIIEDLETKYPAINVDTSLKSKIVALSSSLTRSVPYSSLSNFSTMLRTPRYDKVLGIIVDEKDWLYYDRERWDRLYKKNPRLFASYSQQRPEIQSFEPLGADSSIISYRDSCKDNFPEIYSYFVNITLLPKRKE